MTKSSKSVVVLSDREIVDHVVEKIENAIATNSLLTLPWHCRDGLPRNLGNQRPYNGSNAIRLWGAATILDYVHDLWGTFKSVQSSGGSVRKGERSYTKIVFYHKDDKSMPDGVEDEKVVRKWHAVFNVLQTNLTPAPRMNSRNASDKEADDMFRQIAEVITPTNPAWDALVAELGTALYLGESNLGMPSRDDHAKFMVPWLAMLKRVDEARFSLALASVEARKAVDLVKSQSAIAA